MQLCDRSAIDQMLYADETELIHALAVKASLSEPDNLKILELATSLVQGVRNKRQGQGGIDAFMHEYSLSSEEGVVLMCLAEALLRIPDAATADRLIADKIGGRDWESHLGKSESLFVNASAWGLMLTGKFVTLDQSLSLDAFGFLKRLVRKSGEPILRNAMRQAMRIMGKQFVLAQNMDDALALAQQSEARGYRFSYDMLGESALTKADAAVYFKSYQSALATLASGTKHASVFANASLSVKLSALYPRYEEKQAVEAISFLFDAVETLAVQAKGVNVGLTIDAEEMQRLDLSLELFGKLAESSKLQNWNGLGLAVQAYGKRALPVLEWLAEVAVMTGRVFPVRLVKGAYWDTEIKRAQEAGLISYPVFTRKLCTDVSYLACARYLLSRRDVFYPQLATHNAQTIAAVTVMAADTKGFEFQRLHGMGQGLYEDVVKNQPVRIYAPIGSHKDLLAYLVRRLLENGANTSFVNRLADDAAPVADIVADPVAQVLKLDDTTNPKIALPVQLFKGRKNSSGIALWRGSERDITIKAIEKSLRAPFQAHAIVGGALRGDGPRREIFSPSDIAIKIGEVFEAGDSAVAAAMEIAARAQPSWDALGGLKRGAIIDQAADLYEQNRDLLMGLLVREAGKTLDNAQADLREAVDFLRYYAAEARKHFATARKLAGPTGELNELSLHGKGVFACISPWNFPLAIFTGQIAAALVAGNAVVAKPAEQTPLIAFEAVKLLHQSGVPTDVLHFLPGDGARVGAVMLKHPELSGVAFTGSNETARTINRTLALRDGPIPVFIAETGGLNVMIVDSSALPEQAVRDILASAFDSAGQRCSAARILFVQADIAERVIAMLRGAMQELRIGDPFDYATDIGPVIDQGAHRLLTNYKAKMAQSAKLIYDLPVPADLKRGLFIGPAAYELASIETLNTEVFGPVLHVIRFAGDKLDAVCDEINAKGYGLTLGLHTRLESVVRHVRAKMRVGNFYVNRNQIGAVVGAQPFGGEGLSGTGPKAGGPHYLFRFAVERVCSVDTTASGGNAELLSL